jgi:hypothetical protein
MEAEWLKQKHLGAHGLGAEQKVLGLGPHGRPFRQPAPEDELFAQVVPRTPGENMKENDEARIKKGGHGVPLSGEWRG